MKKSTFEYKGIILVIPHIVSIEKMEYPSVIVNLTGGNRIVFKDSSDGLADLIESTITEYYS